MLAFCTIAYAMVYDFKEFAVHGFSLNMPDDWTVTEDKAGNIFDFNSPDGSVIIAREGESETKNVRVCQLGRAVSRRFSEKWRLVCWEEATPWKTTMAISGSNTRMTESKPKNPTYWSFRHNHGVHIRF